MNRKLLALAFVLGVAILARADYLVIIHNLSAPPPSATAPAGTGPGNPMPMPPMPIMPMPVPGPAQADNPDSIDDDKSLVAAVLEVRLSPKVSTSTFLKLFKHPQAPQEMPFFHRLAPTGTGTIHLASKKPQYEAILLTKENDRPMGTVRDRFKKQADETYKDKDKANPEAVLKLAEKAMEYGLVDDFAKAMDRLGELDKANATPSPKVVAYNKVKEALAKPAGKAVFGPWKEKLLGDYRVVQAEGSRFALVHSFRTDDVPEVKATLRRLDQALRAWYYWWAFKEMALPVPPDRLVAVLTSEDEHFNSLKHQLSARRVANDSFHSPREGLMVFSSKRSDEQYSELALASADYWKSGYHRLNILSGKPNIGVPAAGRARPDVANHARLQALLLRALEEEWNRTATSHVTAREMVYATGLLPRHVHAPEWIQFGVGSFFETPLQSPWAGIGTPNSYWLPRFKDYDKSGIYGEMKGAEKRKSQLATLIATVTDEGFRTQKSTKDAEATLRHARAASWSLTYFLANLPAPPGETKGLMKYARELSRMPRDLDLDREVLLGCFARAFNCWDKEAGKLNLAQLETLADRWFTYARAQKMEGDFIHEQIRKAYAQIRKPTPPSGTVPVVPIVPRP